MEDSMTESLTLLNTTIGFLGTHLALIHIPLEAYSHFMQPILQLLLQSHTQETDEGEVSKPAKPWASLFPFVNISVSPHECSVVCPRDRAEELFAPLLKGLEPSLAKRVSISPNDYSVIMIGGEGLEAGQRVLDLTTPLALAGIPIFFITSYWADFILVPFSSRKIVIQALEARGFIFESDSTNGEAGHMTNPQSPLNNNNHSSHIRTPSCEHPPGTPTTPPPRTVTDLQTRTFKLLARHNVIPTPLPDLQLLTCAGIKDSTSTSCSQNFTQEKLHLGLIRCLTNPSSPPKFLSLTLTDTDSASLTLEKRLIPLFPNAGEDVLLGTNGDVQVPVTFDLSGFDVGTTGLVCGVAGRLVEGMRGRLGGEEAAFDMAYLSTARAGHVVVFEDEVGVVVEVLKGVGGDGA
ncbi:hypothetical protein MBLNU230_g4780t2 [Neophaeotheca triangularis]